MLGNMKFISRAEQDITLVRFSLTHEISCSTLEINFIFPRNHVIFSIYKFWCVESILLTLITDEGQGSKYKNSRLKTIHACAGKVVSH